MGLTSEKTLQKVQSLFDEFFNLNSLLDRHVYLLDNKWNLPKYQDYVHHSISHAMPLLADLVQDFGSLRGDLFHRGMVPAHNEDYNSVSEMTQSYVMELAEVEKLCADCIYTAIENKDLMYEDFIRDFEINKVAPLIKQAVVFYNAIKSYEQENSIAKWNKDFTTYIIPQFQDKGEN
jgi:hypothetical protein